MAKHVRVFISYSHKDDDLRDRLRAHLSQLERDGLVGAWDDRAIPAGGEWADEIDQRLQQADIILLLVSTDFIRSDYCYRKEMMRAIERHQDKNDRAIVIPVILRRCDWESAPFAKLQSLPRDGRPLTDWKSEDDYFTDVAKGLRRRILSLVEPGQGWLPRIGASLRDPAWWQRPRVLATSLLSLTLLVVVVVWWRTAATKVSQAVHEGTALLRVGRYVEAQAQMEPVCLRWLVGNPACFVRDKAALGAMLERQGSSLDVEAFAQQLASLKARHPADDPDLLLFAGGLALQVRDPTKQEEQLKQAGQAFDRAIELDPRFAEAYYYQANVRLMRARTEADYRQARDLLDKAIETVPNASHYLNVRAYARRRMGDRAGAEADYRQSADAGSILSRIELAELLWLAGRFNDAADQQDFALKQMAQGAMTVRNALPWVFDLSPGRILVLKATEEKSCYARLTWQASQALAGIEGRPETTGCGAYGREIARAVATALNRAIREGLPAAAVPKAEAFVAKLVKQDDGKGA